MPFRSDRLLQRSSRRALRLVASFPVLCVASGTAQAQVARVTPAPVADGAIADSSARDRALLERIQRLETRLAEERRRDSLDASRRPVVGAGEGGFNLRSPDGQFLLRLRGYFQSDGRFFVNDPTHRGVSTFVLRRVRPLFEVTAWRIVDVRLMPDFGGGQATIYDAHVDLRLSPAFNIRSGKFKPPVGLERLQSATDLEFIERSHVTNLVPNRDVGAQIHGDLMGGRVSYAGGIFNGVEDLGFGDGDNGNGKDLAGRVFVTPFARVKGSALRELGVGISGSRGVQRGTVAAPFLPSIRTPAQQRAFTYRSDGRPAGTTIADGLHTRVSPQGYLYAGPLGVLWEGIRSSQVVRRDSSVARLDSRAYNVTASWMLTGEAASYRNITPRTPFDPTRGSWGAFELAARLSGLTVDRDAFPVFADPALAIREQRTLGVAANWYLSRGIRLQLNYVDTRFAGGAPDGADRPAERTIMTRVQHSF